MVCVFNGKLLLKCKRCLAKKEIRAKTNDDLMDLLNKDYIFLEK